MDYIEYHEAQRVREKLREEISDLRYKTDRELDKLNKKQKLIRTLFIRIPLYFLRWVICPLIVFIMAALIDISAGDVFCSLFLFTVIVMGIGITRILIDEGYID